MRWHVPLAPLGLSDRLLFITYRVLRRLAMLVEERTAEFEKAELRATRLILPPERVS